MSSITTNVFCLFTFLAEEGRDFVWTVHVGGVENFK